jgi:serine/threonine protein kinase
MVVDVQGDRTGRVWQYDIVDRLEYSGDRYMATAMDDGSHACLHICEIGTYWEDEIERMRSSIAIASRPEIIAAPTIRQLLDVQEIQGTSGEFGFPGTLTEILEWGWLSLDDYLNRVDHRQTPAEVADEVEANVGAALDVLHGLGLVHLDIAPNNVLYVGREWKLADLDSCLERGAPSLRQPLGERYVHPDRRLGKAVPAREEFDYFGFEHILVEVRNAWA